MRMLQRLPLLCGLLLLFPFATRAQDLSATIKREAQNCTKAVVTSDYENIVLYTHPRIVKQLGGKEAMIEALKDGMADMKASGISFVSVTVGDPQEPKKIGSWITAILPQHIVMKVPNGKVIRDSFLLGISEDVGRHWVFVDLGQTNQQRFAQNFPELDGKLTLPEEKNATFQKDK